MSTPSTQSLLASPNAAVVRRAAARGEWADFIEDGIAFDEQGQVTEPGVVLPAELIRDLLISQRPHGGKGGPGVTAFGVRIRGARIVGRIDLRGARAWNEEACPPLVLEDCELVGNLEEAEWGDPRLRKRNCLDALDADLVYLGLQRCRLAVLDLRNARVRSDVRLDRLGPLVKGGPCWLRAGGSRIQGELRARHCTFRIHQVEDWQPSLPEQSAVDLTRVRVTGSVALQPACLFDGGIRLGNARIGGDLWIAGGHLIARGSSALYAQMAQIDGVLGLRSIESTGGPHHRFRSEGGINLYGATIGSTLELSGAYLAAVEGEDKASASSLSANLTRIGGDVLMRPWKPKVPETPEAKGDGDEAETAEVEAAEEKASASIPEVPFKAEGTIYFNNATIVGFCRLDGSAPYFAASSSELRSFAHITMQGGTLALQGSAIEGELRIGGEIDRLLADSIEARSEAQLNGKFNHPIELSAATVHGDLRIGGEVSGIKAPSLVARSMLRFTGELTGSLFLDSAEVSGDVRIFSQKPVAHISATNARFSAPFNLNGSLQWLSLSGSHFAGQVSLRGKQNTVSASNARFDSHFESKSYLDKLELTSSRLAGRLTLEGRCDRLIAPSVEVEGEVSLRCVFRQQVDLRNASFGSSFSWVPRRYLWSHLFPPGGLGSLQEASAEEPGASSKKKKPGASKAERPAEELEQAVSAGSEGWAVNGVVSVILQDGAWFEGWDDVRFVHRRRRELACYPEWQLWECIAWLPLRVESTEIPPSAVRSWPPGDLGIVAFLYDPEEKLLVLLDGRSSPIHQLNSYGALQLETPEQVEDYLRFFCSYIWGDEGAFQILETLDQLPESTEARFIDSETGKVTRDPGSWVQPLVAVDRGLDGVHFSRGTVLYGGALFEATFRCHSTGMVDMLDDEPCGWLQGDPPVLYRQPARVVLRKRVRGAEGAKDTSSGGTKPGWIPPPQLAGEWIDESAGLGTFRAQGLPAVRWILENARCGGDISLEGNMEPLRARGLRVGGQLTLRGAVGETLDLEASRIGGNLIFDASESLTFGSIPFRLRASEKSYTQRVQAGRGSPEPDLWMLNLESATIGGALYVGGLEALYAERATETLQWHEGHRIALRSRSLPCLPGWRHGEALVVLEQETSLQGLWPVESTREALEVAVVGFLREESGGRLLLLDSLGESLRKLLREGKFQLDRQEETLCFLRLWYGTIDQAQGKPGAKILAFPEDAAGLPPLVAINREAVKEEGEGEVEDELELFERFAKEVEGREKASTAANTAPWAWDPPRWSSPQVQDGLSVTLTWLFGAKVYSGTIEFSPSSPPPSLYQLDLGPPVAELTTSPLVPRVESSVRIFPSHTQEESAPFEDLSGVSPGMDFPLPAPWIAADWQPESDEWTAAERYAELLESAGGSRNIDFWTLVYGEVAEPKVAINLHRCSSGALVDEDGQGWGPRLRLKLDGFDYGWTDASQQEVSSSLESTAGSFVLNPQTARDMQRNRRLEHLSGWRRRGVTLGWRMLDRWEERLEALWRLTLPRQADRQRPWERRLGWLDRQFDRQLAASYSPQPFEHLASVLRKQGAEEGARRTLLHKLQFERRDRRSLRYLFAWFYDLTFGHGLQPLRAWTTFALFIVLGTLCADYGTQGVTWRFCREGPTVLEAERELRSDWAQWSGFSARGGATEPRPPAAEGDSRSRRDELPIMVYRVEAVTEIATSELDRWSTEEILSAEGRVRPLEVPAGFAREVPCIDRVQPLLYALDVFVPLVDLDQEPLCMVSARPDAWGWRWLKGIYRAFGWVVTSLLLLTVTGVLRKHVER